jgi:hypothetical protein
MNSFTVKIASRVAGFATLLVAMLVFAISCGGTVATGSEPEPEPVGPSEGTSLKSLSVYYSDQNETDSIIIFSPNKIIYKIDDTDSARPSFTVTAEAVEGASVTTISYVYGDDSRASPGQSGKVELESVPLPRTQDSLVITIKVENEGYSPSVYTVTVDPPAFDTTLAILQVKFASDGAGGENLVELQPGKLQYSVIVNEAGKVGNAINITATVSSPTADALVFSPSNVVMVPAAGLNAAVVTIAVSNGGFSTVYTISIVPPRSVADDDVGLRDIQFVYQDNSVADLVIDGDTSFYTVQIPQTATKTKITAATARSSHSSVTVMVGAVPYNITNLAETTLINLPVRGGTDVIFTVTVTAQNLSTRAYRITFTNPTHSIEWKGDAAFTTTNTNGKFIRTVEAEVTGVSVGSSNVIDGSWSLMLNDNIRPTAFVVVMKKNNGTEAAENWITYRKSFPVEDSWQAETNISLLVDAGSTARMIYNANDLAEIGSALNQAENWYLANDIDLSEYRNGSGARIDWDGPNDYHGVFDGNGHTINLILSRTTGDTGLFDSLTCGAVIKNFTLNAVTDPLKPDGLEMTAGAHFGGVVGLINTNATGEIKISNVTVTGNLIYKSGSSFLIVGGLLGEVSRENKSTIKIENCVSNLNMNANLVAYSDSGTWRTFGGLIGRADSNGNTGGGGSISIKNSYTTGNINAVNSVAVGTIYSGGIVAWYYSENNTNLLIENCFSTGQILAQRTVAKSGDVGVYAGGILGGTNTSSANARIINCAALNPSIIARTVDGTVMSGQIMGSAKVNTVLTNNFSYDGMLLCAGNASSVPAPNISGALHNNEKGAPKTEANFKDIRTWTDAASAGTGGLGFSPAIWNFDNIAIDGYPKLR